MTTSTDQDEHQSPLAATMSQPRNDNLLCLPAEILGRIAEQCDVSTDIFALRLTCRDLAGAAFLPFTKEYISELSCFILDPNRLSRISNILGSPHLLEKVRKMVLTTNAHENRFDVHLAPNDGEDRSNTDSNALDSWATDRYVKFYCPLTGISAQNWTTVQDILKNLGRQERQVSIDVDLIQEPGIDQALARKRPRLAQELFELVIESGGTVVDFETSNQYDIEMTEFRPSSKFHHILRGLEKFEYADRSTGLARASDAQRLEHEEFIQTVLRNSSNLQKLDIDLDGWKLWGVGTLRTMWRNILPGPMFPALRNVTLDCMDSERHTLMAFLERCRDSLQTLILNWVQLEDDQYPWSGILKQLSTFPQLEKLGLDGSSIIRPIDRTVHYCYFLLPGEYSERRSKRMDNTKGVEAGEFLKLNLERGLVYKEHRPTV